MRNRQPGQRAGIFTARERRIHGARCRAALLGQKSHYRIHRRIDALDLPDVRVHDFQSGKIARTDAGRQLVGGQKTKFF